MEGAPALGVEAISKSNTAEIMRRKVDLYMEYGGREAWVCYPRSKLVVVHRGRTAEEIECTLTSQLLTGLSLDLREIFRAR